jgi:hypothetical protein
VCGDVRRNVVGFGNTIFYDVLDTC